MHDSNDILKYIGMHDSNYNLRYIGMHYELVEIVSKISYNYKSTKISIKILKYCNGIDIVNMIYYSSVINLIV